ncbi:MAG: hypothetical protein HFG64_06960 [Lachnospiraceae bacterium]|nr:hypothetical protein [Lachnospiraceae bacterium]
MKERINRLAKGIVDAEVLETVMQPEQISATILAGELVDYELYIADTAGRYIKGLVYSSNIRVRLKNHAFGGIRNRISYEVDTTYLTQGDVIEGAFYLVTSGGERKVPYSFGVELGASGKLLDALKTPADYAQVARMDLEMALRIYDYQDFVEAPFMQDIHVRAMYDGLRTGPNRQNQLEEFLVGIEAKEPVELACEDESLLFENVQEIQAEKLKIRRSGWGYIQFTVSVEGDFLELPRNTFTSQDFQEQVCGISYQINPAYLHRGKNLGGIRIDTVRQHFFIPMEVWGAGDNGRKKRRVDYSRYLALRLLYELGDCQEKDLENQMRQEAEHLRREYGENAWNLLIQAELAMLDGQEELALSSLDGSRKDVLDQRQEQVELFCFYQYLTMRIRRKEGMRDALIRQVKKYVLEEQKHPYLYLLWLKLEPEKAANPAEMLGQMRLLFKNGCRSPFLYAMAFKLLRQNPGMMVSMEAFELQVMVFAARKGILDIELARRTAELAGVTRHYHQLYERLLIYLYQHFQDKEFLSPVCGMMIRGDCRQEKHFPWYQKALEEGISLTRLYEYFLYSLPEDYPCLLPQEVLMYFSYEKSMDDYSRSVLYANILRYMDPDKPLYKQYERDIEQFTMEQLLKSRVDERLVVLYQHMIYKEMIDSKVARVLPSILRSCRLTVEDSRIRSVIICYEELETEDVCPVRDNVVYVPLFLERSVLLFQDGSGNRYANIPCEKQAALDKVDVRELEEKCYEICPDHPMLRLEECELILREGIQGPADETALKRTNATMKLHPLYRRRILAQMIAYHQRRVEQDGAAAQDVEYLLNLNLEQLNQEERAGVCETLVDQGYMREAYRILIRYGWERIRSGRLLKLCGYLAGQRRSGEDEILLATGCRLFSEGRYDGVLLDYLCAHFNGSAKQMFKILNQAVRDRVDVHDMPERLLAQMVFTGSTDWMDQVFDWYTSGKKINDSLVKAYFTLKSSDYFLKEKPTDGRVFAYLEGAVQTSGDKSRIPTIYLLALGRYYASCQELDEEQTALCQTIMDILIGEGRVFAWMKDLGGRVRLPDSVLDQVIVEYHSSRDARPELQIRILPEEEEFHPDELRRVYPGIFIRQKVLFEGELLEYQIFELQEEERVLVKEGGLSCNPDHKGPEGSRYAALNEMGLCLSLREETKLKEKMIKYLTDTAAMEELFSLL